MNKNIRAPPGGYIRAVSHKIYIMACFHVSNVLSYIKATPYAGKFYITVVSLCDIHVKYYCLV